MSNNYIDGFLDELEELALEYACENCTEPNCDNCPYLDSMTERQLRKTKDKDPTFFQDI